MPGSTLAVTALIGSPRRQNTLHLVQVIEDELKKLGPVTVEYVFLAERNIEFCRGCMQCMARGWEFCPIKDDVADIIARIERSDGVILASPVYVFHVTAQTKKFLDRLPAFCHRPQFFHKQAMAAGTTGAVGIKPVLSYMKSMLSVLGFRTVVSVGGKGQEDDGSFPAKLEEKARKTARRFYRNLQKGDASQPSFNSIMQFRVQRAVFTPKDPTKVFPKDHEHYSALKGRRYWVDAPIRPCKLAVAWVVEKFAGLFIRLM